MDNKYSRESPRVIMLKKRDSLIRRICYSILALMLASAGAAAWRHQKRLELYGYQTPMSAPVEFSSSPGAYVAGASRAIKTRSVVTSMFFGEREISALNSKGEYIPGGAAVFASNLSPASEREVLDLRLKFLPTNLRIGADSYNFNISRYTEAGKEPPPQ